MSSAESPPPPPATAGPETFPTMMSLMTERQRADLEAMSANLAEAALSAQKMLSASALRAVENPQPVSLDPMHVAGAMGEVMTALASQPERLVQAQTDLYARYMDLWRNAALAAVGQPAPAPCGRARQGRQALRRPRLD